MRKKVYCGKRNPLEAGPGRVWVNGRPLDPARSLKVARHSPDGFQWGYGGSGPAQLALALLLDCLGSVRAAAQWYQQFKAQVVAALGDQWVMTEDEIRGWYTQARPEKLDACGNDERSENEETNDQDPDSGGGAASAESEAAGGGLPVLEAHQNSAGEPVRGLFDVQ